MLSSFVDQRYLSSLRRSQNTDGGWGFNAGCESRVEPTVWALIALQEFESSEATEESLERGFNFLAAAQLEDGSWAASRGQTEGCWVTSLACWALGSRPQDSTSLQKGLRWLNVDKPRDSGFWFRFLRRLAARKSVSAQDPSLSGWSWTPNTASWVEPTCYALIVNQVQGTGQNSDARRRCELAEAMLYDRMCPGGGWNCGNPRVYGVAGQPQVGPTVWALIALRENSQRAENRRSLEWLERNREKVQSPESLALTNMALKVYNKGDATIEDSAVPAQTSPVESWSMPALAWAALARSENARWLNKLPQGKL